MFLSATAAALCFKLLENHLDFELGAKTTLELAGRNNRRRRASAREQASAGEQAASSKENRRTANDSSYKSIAIRRSQLRLGVLAIIFAVDQAFLLFLSLFLFLFLSRARSYKFLAGQLYCKRSPLVSWRPICAAAAATDRWPAGRTGKANRRTGEQATVAVVPSASPALSPPPSLEL